MKQHLSGQTSARGRARLTSQASPVAASTSSGALHRALPVEHQGDRLALMETFVRIVEAGSLSAAASQLQSTQPTISRRLQTLERSLGLRLLQRSTHVMRLTPDGERYFEGAKQLLADWAAFDADLRGAEEEPQGVLRVAIGHAFGQDKFMLPLAEFLRSSPGVSVDWLLQDDVSDFIASGIDCAIHVGEPTDESVVAIRIAEVVRTTVCAPALLEGRPVPTHPRELSELPWLALLKYYRGELSLAHARTGETQRVALRTVMGTNSLFSLRSAALLGLGAGVASAWMVADDLAEGRLVALAPDWKAAPLPVYIVYPHARFYPSRLRRFVALMRQAIPPIIEG